MAQHKKRARDVGAGTGLETGCVRAAKGAAVAGAPHDGCLIEADAETQPMTILRVKRRRTECAVRALHVQYLTTSTDSSPTTESLASSSTDVGEPKTNADAARLDPWAFRNGMAVPSKQARVKLQPRRGTHAHSDTHTRTNISKSRRKPFHHMATLPPELLRALLQSSSTSGAASAGSSETQQAAGAQTTESLEITQSSPDSSFSCVLSSSPTNPQQSSSPRMNGMISDRIRIIDVVPVNQSDVASTKQFVPNIGNQDSCTFLLPDGDADMDSSPFVYDLYVSRESRQHASRILPLDSYPTVEIPPERERADSLSAKHTHGVVLADSRHAHVFGMPVPQGNENTSESSFDTTDEDSNISDKTVDGSVDYPSTPSPSDAEAEHEIGVETGGYTEDWDEHEQELEFGPDFSQHVDELYDLQKMRLDMNGPQEDSIPVAFRANVASKRDAVHRKVDSSTAYEPTGACATQSSSSNGSATDTEDEDDEEERRELERLKERFALTLSRAAATPTATATRDRELTSSE